MMLPINFLYFQDQVLKSGMLTKKTQRTHRWIKHWFVLKNDALSWYQSSAVSLLSGMEQGLVNLITSRILTSHMALPISAMLFLASPLVTRIFAFGQTRRQSFLMRILCRAETNG